MSGKIEVFDVRTGERRQVDHVSIFPDGRIMLVNEGKDEFIDHEGEAFIISNPEREETARISFLAARRTT